MRKVKAMELGKFLVRQLEFVFNYGERAGVGSKTDLINGLGRIAIMGSGGWSGEQGTPVNWGNGEVLKIRQCDQYTVTATQGTEKFLEEVQGVDDKVELNKIRESYAKVIGKQLYRLHRARRN